MLDKKKKFNSVVKQREAILEEENLQLVRVFDTYEHEPDKDVVLAKDKDSEKVVLRIGEIRSPDIFSAGYIGKYFVVPKLLKSVEKRGVIYEIEEYLQGKLLSDFMPRPTAQQPVPEKILDKLIKAHWEFQVVARKLENLKIKWEKKDLLKYYDTAKKFFTEKVKGGTEEVIQGKKWQFFWQEKYPAKWKFSPDNLLLTPEGKIGFIDLAKIGKRYWGYDLGWIFWPLWFHFSNVEYKKVEDHFGYLETLFARVYKYAPSEGKENKNLFFLKSWLIVFERIIGSLYDAGAGIYHAQKNIGKGERCEAFISFLTGLLKLILEKVIF